MRGDVGSKATTDAIDEANRSYRAADCARNPGWALSRTKPSRPLVIQDMQSARRCQQRQPRRSDDRRRHIRCLNPHLLQYQ
jgi:hypothetical protein